MLKRRIPKIVIALTCIIALLMQYASTVVMAAMSYTDRTAKLVISPLHEGGEESSGTLTDEQKAIYDEESYVYFIGNTRVYKISKEGSLFEDPLYCLDASKSFPAQTSTTYTNVGELSENETYNTNSLKWLMNNIYLQKQEPETKDAFLEKAFNGSDFDVDAVKAILTDDDIDVIQQYAIWHFTNNNDSNYNHYGAIRVISAADLGAGGIVDVNNAKSLSDIDREKYSQRPDMAKHLYDYLVDSAQNASSPVANVYPTIKNISETRTVIQNGFYVAGPFEITSGNVEYDVKFVDQNNNELRGYNVILENGSIATQPLNKINTPFYIQLPTTTETTSMKLKLSYNKYETKATIWQPEENDKQPVVLINRLKENVEQEKPVTIVKKGVYNLEIIKQDKSSKARLAGAKFNVQIGSGEIQTYTTDSSGILTIPQITITETGTDRIKITENEAPAGYTKTEGTLELEVTKAEVENELVATEVKTLQEVEGMTTALNNKKVTVTVDNEKIEITGKYEIELIKQDKDSKEKLSGAEFGIKFGTEAEKTYITDNQGKITIPNIEITEAGTDKITIREIKAPTGYRQIGGKIEMMVTTAEFDGKYAINDIQVANSILNASVNLASNEKIAIVVDNEKEETPPEEPSTYKLQVIKRDKNLNVNLDGADFSIQIGNQEPKIYTTNEAGIIEIPEIEIKSSGTDRIILQEINPPYGYIANDGKIELIVTKTDVGGKYKITKLESEKTTAEVEDAYIDDKTQTVVVKVCNTKIPYEKPEDEKIKGKYEIEIVKVDRKGEIIKAPANFNVDGKVYTTQNGTVKVAEVDINKSNVNQTDKYTIKETKSPDGYTKFDGTIEVEVLKKLSDDEGSYKATNVNMIVRDSEGNQLHRGDKITITTKNGVTTITITVVNYEKVDLALRKFISAVNQTENFENATKLDREPKVDLEDLDNGKSTTAKYNHSKETVIVKKGNYILYTLRTYNEGNCDAMASQVTDYLPEGLEFVRNAKENNIWNYDEETRKLTTNENYKPELLAAHKKGEELKYQDIQVVCKVKEDIEEDANIVNIAEITEAKYNDGTVAEDRDSTTNNLKYPEDLSKYNGGNDSNKEDEYIPGQEDDDDFERILVKSIKGYYDLEIVKVDNNGNIIKESSAKFDINGKEKETTDGSIKIENVEINKHNAETPDTYTIQETNAPKDYTKFKIPIRIEVSKKLSEDKEKYEIDSVSMKILSGEIIDSKDFEVVTENGKTTIVVKVVNYPKVDLALRKFITAVSKDTTFEQSEYVEDREPKVDIKDLDEGKSTTAEYKHSKTTVEVEKEDYILYTIRVYNEGKVNAYPTEVTDYLPEGLEFVADAKENRIWDYDSDTRKLTTNSKYEAKLLKAHEVGKDLDYVDLQVVCRVSENVKEDTDIVNIAEITLIKHEDGTTAEDRDSTPDNVKPEDYKPNTEDDDDQEKVLVKSIKGEYNLKVVKVDENGKTISDIVTKFKINDEEKETTDGVIELSKVEINKDNVDKKDTYEISEIEAPKGYEKIDDTIKLEVSKKLAENEKSYVLDKAEFVIEEKDNTDEDKKDDKKEEDKKEDDKKEDNASGKKETRTNKIDGVASVTVKDGTIEVKVVNKKIEEPKKPDEPQKPDEPKQPDNPQQPTPEQPKTPDTPQKEIPKETITTPSTGDVLPVVALGTIMVVALINIVQIAISKKKSKK